MISIESNEKLNQDLLNELISQGKYIIEWNETNSTDYPNSFLSSDHNKEEVTPILLVEMMKLEQIVYDKHEGYYKVKIHGQGFGNTARLDIGDGLDSNLDLYKIIANDLNLNLSDLLLETGRAYQKYKEYLQEGEFTNSKNSVIEEVKAISENNTNENHQEKIFEIQLYNLAEPVSIKKSIIDQLISTKNIVNEGLKQLSEIKELISKNDENSFDIIEEILESESYQLYLENISKATKVKKIVDSARTESTKYLKDYIKKFDIYLDNKLKEYGIDKLKELSNENSSLKKDILEKRKQMRISELTTYFDDNISNYPFNNHIPKPKLSQYLTKYPKFVSGSKSFNINKAKSELTNFIVTAEKCQKIIISTLSQNLILKSTAYNLWLNWLTEMPDKKNLIFQIENAKIEYQNAIQQEKKHLKAERIHQQQIAIQQKELQKQLQLQQQKQNQEEKALKQTANQLGIEIQKNTSSSTVEDTLLKEIYQIGQQFNIDFLLEISSGNTCIEQLDNTHFAIKRLLNVPKSGMRSKTLSLLLKFYNFKVI